MDRGAGRNGHSSEPLTSVKAISPSPRTLQTWRETPADFGHSAKKQRESPDRLKSAILTDSSSRTTPWKPTAASLVGSNTKILDELSAYADSGLTHLIAGISRFGDMSFDGALGALEEVAAEILPKAPSPLG